MQDDGGTDNGGVDTDPTPKTMTINVTSVNDAPVGTATTVSMLEDTAHTFAATDFGFTDPNDSPPNNFYRVEITTLPTNGTLQLSGTAVTAGQFIDVSDITAGNLIFTPAANANGSPYATFTFQVQDDGGTDNGGVDTDPTPNTMTIKVTNVNDAPAGTDKTVSTLVGTAYTFAVADFGFTDPNDSPANNFYRVEITTLPAAGTLNLSGTAVTAGQFVAVTDITAGNLTFTPAANANGSPYASFTFQVQDDGGTANDGVDTDPTPKTMTINVTRINGAPAGTDKTVTTLEDTAYTFAVADFGFTDPNDTPPNNFYRVEITTLPASGTLELNGTAVTAGQFVNVTDITAGNLTFTPAANANGSPYASFTFQVQDDGGTANGGVDTDPTPNTMTVNVTSVNDAPAGTDKTVTTPHGTSYTFSMADFGFTDPNDNPPDDLYRVEITTLPTNGTLKLDGAAVTAGQFVNVTKIIGGKLTFDPGSGEGNAYASFTFQVQDDGGTDNGGVDTDPTPNTMTINVGGTSSVVGFVYCDNDNDGVYTGNATVPNVTVTLQYQGNAGQWQNWTTSPYRQTNSAGWYGFNGLPAGTYRVIMTQPVAFTAGGAGPDHQDVQPGLRCAASRELWRGRAAAPVHLPAVDADLDAQHVADRQRIEPPAGCGSEWGGLRQRHVDQVLRRRRRNHDCVRRNHFRFRQPDAHFADRDDHESLRRRRRTAGRQRGGHKHLEVLCERRAPADGRSPGRRLHGGPPQRQLQRHGHHALRPDHRPLRHLCGQRRVGVEHGGESEHQRSAGAVVGEVVRSDGRGDGASGVTARRCCQPTAEFAAATSVTAVSTQAAPATNATAAVPRAIRSW